MTGEIVEVVACDALSLEAVLRATAAAQRIACAPRAHVGAARLVQASREDLDALVVDNLARAAKRNRFEVVAVGNRATVLEAPPPDSRSTVLSIQRLPLPPGRTAAWAAHEYPRWCDRALGPVRAIVEANDTVRLRIRPSNADVLVLAPIVDEGDRYVWHIAGGRLAKPAQRGTFELREIDGALFSIVHDFEPSLPWWIYRATEAVAHVRVMHAFGRAIAGMS